MFSMYFDLPDEIKTNIFLYDDTYIQEFNKSIQLIRMMPEFQCCKETRLIFSKNFSTYYISNAFSYKKNFMVISYNLLPDKTFIK